jgi:type I restriction enzyme M protein
MIDYKTNPDTIIKLLKTLGFKLKDGANRVYSKKYLNYNSYTIEIDFEKESINYGNKIKVGDRTTSNFKANENFVVLECVNRLLEIGYKPESIILEKIYRSGHGTSGKLDILVMKDSQAFLMIECKTWGFEFEKELNKIQKNGGQLFTYFQQDRATEYLTLYTSNFDPKTDEIFYKNCIIKIESHYRDTSNIEDLFDRWNKLFKDNGIFENGIIPYNIKSKALTLNKLKKIKEEDSSFIFNRFLEILRHNVVSDKPNAFNKMFTLFLCKIIDEDKTEDKELEFQWLDTDTHITFQKRLTDLYKRGMKELLEKEITDTSDEKFDEQFANQINDEVKEQIKNILTELRLKKNNEFAIKEVFDDNSFEDNAKVVKEVVELLQYFKIRYNEKQQYLGDFFELLLTTGLKQEAGQFFTPVPIARFIINSIPLKELTENKIKRRKD